MTPHDDENNWADLADALGIDTPVTQARKQAATPAPPEPEQPPPLPDWAALTDDLPDATEPDGDTMLEPLLAAESSDGDPGTDGKGEGDRKRRRRRRRRKPGDPVNPTTAETEADDESEDAGPAATAESEDDEEEAEREPELAGVGIADEPTPDAVRDLISNWNVPSWQEIVTGLYRPGGDRSGG